MIARGIGIVVTGFALGGLLAWAEPPAPQAAPKTKGKNLVVNGDFEEGEKTPKGWQTIDGLSSFWVKDSDPRHGKVIKLDTDVYQSQAYEWWSKLCSGALPKDAPKKKATVGDKYDTLAGLDGVFFWSDYIPVEKGKAYWLTMDVKGPGLLAWLVGYPEKGSTAFGSEMAAVQEYLRDKKAGKPREKKRGHEPFIHTYTWKGQLAAGGASEWKTCSRRKKPFRPTSVTPNVKYVRILILPTWPPGEYFIDNVKLLEVDEDKDGQ
jgi:hypothetical protein